jgi:hypothetical protein
VAAGSPECGLVGVSVAGVSLQGAKKVEGTKGNLFEATTWHGVDRVGLAAKVGVDNRLSSTIARPGRGGAALVVKMREARSVGALGAFL